jgi:hypothetical protein
MTFTDGAIDSSIWDISTGDYTTVFLKDPCDNVELSYIEMKEDGGVLLFVDMPCVNSVVGSEQSYTMKIDGSNALKVYGVSNASVLSETAVVVETTYFALGDPTVSGSWRFRIDVSGLQIEKFNGINWVQKGQFN